MRFFFIICFLISSFASVSQKQKVDTNFHVYLLIGQSNMAGRAPLDAESKKINPRILMLDSLNKWVAATDPVHFDKPSVAGVGPAISFGSSMLEGDKNIKIGLIPCALGGSPIKVWEPNAVYLKVYHPYDDAVQRARIAMQEGVLKGILWHQGESDNDSVHAPLYISKLKTLIDQLRSDLKQPNLPFIAGEIGHFNKVNFINGVIDQLPQCVSNTAVVSAKELTDKGDHLHFNTPSARILGKRYADAMKQLYAKANLKTASK
jgi:hypothetical protein